MKNVFCEEDMIGLIISSEDNIIEAKLFIHYIALVLT